MAGLFGFGGKAAPGVPAGILGSQTIGDALFGNGYQDSAGVLGPALQDAIAYFSGRPDAATHLAPALAQQQQRNQVMSLVSNLNSDDPAVRQQAYAIAPLFGVDPSAFQKQRAAQSLPQLLTSMKPHDVNVEGVSADAGPYGKISLPGFTLGQAPGLSPIEALSQPGIAPELQAEYLPKIMDNAFKSQDPFTLSADQVRYDGAGNIIAKADSKPKDPLLKTIRVGNQDVTYQWNDQTKNWDEFQRGNAFKPDSAADSASGVVVAPGGQLVDRRTGIPLYTAPPKKLPASVQAAESDDISAIQTSRAISKDLGVVQKQINDGQLTLSPFANTAGAAMNYLGVGNDNSHRLATLKSTLEKLRNDSLRLNKGVQTEGDAQRAWNEVLNNLNDQKLVSERLQEIQDINSRAANLRAQQIDLRRKNFDYPAFDASQINPQSALGRPGSTGNPNTRKPTVSNW